MISRELKKKIKEMEEKLIYEDKMKRELLNKDIDGDYLLYLMEKCSVNPDLVVTIFTKKGDKIVLQTKYKSDSESYSMNGNPTELEIR